MKIRNLIVCLTIIVLFTFNVKGIAQEDPPTKGSATDPFRQEPRLRINHSEAKGLLNKEKLFVGSAFEIALGNLSVVNIAPYVGYKVTDQLQLGVGITYWYMSESVPPYFYQTNLFGGSAFARFFIKDFLFIHAEYELLNVESLDFPGLRTLVDNKYLGIGLKQPISEKESYTLMLLFNFEPTTYFSNPTYRVGFNFEL